MNQQPVEQGSNGEPTNPPPPPDDPHPAAAQNISRQEVQSEVKGIEDRVKRAELWMIWLTAAIAFSGFCAVGVGIVQWREIHAGSTDTHDLAIAAKTQAEKMQSMSDAADKIRQAAENMVTQDQRIADNAQKALDASSKQSKASLDTSIASSRQDQRAWLGASDYTYSITESGPIESSAIVLNIGKSPAMEVLCRISGTTKPKGYSLSDSDIVYSTDLTILKEGTLFPNQHFPIKAGGTPMDIGKQKIWFGNVLNGDWIQYFFGEVRYKDTFGTDHWTHFCTQFVPATKGGTPCPIYNDTDDSKRK